VLNVAARRVVAAVKHTRHTGVWHAVAINPCRPVNHHPLPIERDDPVAPLVAVPMPDHAIAQLGRDVRWWWFGVRMPGETLGHSQPG